MSVSFSIRDNQNAGYYGAAAIGAASGYLAKNLLPLNGAEYGSALNSKEFLTQAAEVCKQNKAAEYNLIKGEIEDGTLVLDNLAKDIFQKSKEELVSGNISNVLRNKTIPKETKNSISELSKRISKQGKAGWAKAIENTEAITKHTRSTFVYVLLGMLAAMSVFTIANSAKKVSDITDNKAQLNIEI